MFLITYNINTKQNYWKKMDSQLKNFINDLFKHDYTKLQVNKDGLSIINISLNYHLKIFSDKFNGFYFELSSESGRYFDLPKAFPTYRTENFQECKLIIDDLIHRIDTSKLHLNQKAPKYIDLFRKILKEDSLPEGYKINYGHDFIELLEEKTGYTLKMPQYFIKNTKTFLNERQEPTAILNLHIYLQKDHLIDSNQNQNAVILYIPRYAIKDYPLLNSELAIKNQDVVTDNLGNWFDNLNKLESIQKSGTGKLVEYYALNEGIEHNGTTINKRPKL